METNTVSIVTFVPEDVSLEYAFRAMKNVDEQTHPHWYHYMVCESEALQNHVKSLVGLRSAEYIRRVFVGPWSVPRFSEDFVAIHPVEDFWSPLFLEKMIAELHQCPLTVAGAWCEYNVVEEVLRGKIISTDRTIPGPKVSGMIPPVYSSTIQATFSQALYHIPLIREALLSVSPDTNPYTFALSILYDQDVLGVPEALAFVHKRPPPLIDMEREQFRNWVYRYHPNFVLLDHTNDSR